MTLRTVLGAVALIIVFVALASYANRSDAKLSKTSDCVVATAKAQGYTGNPYSQEAWTLFAGDCK